MLDLIVRIRTAVDWIGLVSSSEVREWKGSSGDLEYYTHLFDFNWCLDFWYMLLYVFLQSLKINRLSYGTSHGEYMVVFRWELL